MTVFWVVIVPAVLAGIFLIAVWVLIAKCLFARIRAWHAEEMAANVPVAILRMQADVIIDVISELEVNRLSYENFPSELMSHLLDAHNAWADSSRERKGIHR